MKELLCLLLISLCAQQIQVKAEILETVAQWNLLKFALPYGRAFQENYNPKNVVPTGLEISSNRIFISLPRFWTGVPATLVSTPRVSEAGFGHSPYLEAYPSWEWHSAGKGYFNCSQMISVFRTRIDKCNRLWVLDSGNYDTMEKFQALCPPKILIFDLSTDNLERVIEFPEQVVKKNSLFTNFVIDDTNAPTCNDVYAYIADTIAPGIVVLDASNDRSWRAEDATMAPDPHYSTYHIGKDTFDLADGIMGIALSPRQGVLYFQPAASLGIYGVPTSALKAGPTNDKLPVSLVAQKSSQGLGLAVNSFDDSIIFAPMSDTSVVSWQPQLNTYRVLAQSPEKIQFAPEIKWVESDSGNIWVLTSRLHKFMKKTLDPRDVNIRILRIRPEYVAPKYTYIPVNNYGSYYKR